MHTYIWVSPWFVPAMNGQGLTWDICQAMWHLGTLPVPSYHQLLTLSCPMRLSICCSAFCSGYHPMMHKPMVSASLCLIMALTTPLLPLSHFFPHTPLSWELCPSKCQHHSRRRGLLLLVSFHSHFSMASLWGGPRGMHLEKPREGIKKRGTSCAGWKWNVQQSCAITKQPKAGTNTPVRERGTSRRSRDWLRSPTCIRDKLEKSDWDKNLSRKSWSGMRTTDFQTLQRLVRTVMHLTTYFLATFFFFLTKI